MVTTVRIVHTKVLGVLKKVFVGSILALKIWTGTNAGTFFEEYG